MGLIAKCFTGAAVTAGVGILGLAIINLPTFVAGDLDYFPGVAILVGMAGLVAGALAVATALTLKRVTSSRSDILASLVGGVVACLAVWFVSDQLALVTPLAIGGVLGLAAAAVAWLLTRNEPEVSSRARRRPLRRL